MRSSIAFSVLSVLAVASAQTSTGKLGDALVVTDNPVGAVYVAALSDGGKVSGSVSAVAASNGTGVSFTVSFKDLPKSGGPFLYHIHDLAVPANGSCASTLAHQDPYQRGEDPPCDSSNPKTCQVGDLSGKYGKVTADPFEASYTDLYASTKPGSFAFFGNRSIVVHYANKTRIACANFELKSSTNATASATAAAAPTTSSTPSSVPKPPPAPPAPGAAAAGAMAPLSLLFGAFLAALML
ncbi:MAG: hypothetical protein M1839_004373 [Geoglossum umbratile]|nr:MAG: hypothetical protein M1839_004373 [Geoglossum umbratile]